MNEKVFCPLIDNTIDCVDCMENRDIKEEYIPQKYKEKKDWKNICKNCKYSKY